MHYPSGTPHLEMGNGEVENPMNSVAVTPFVVLSPIDEFSVWVAQLPASFDEDAAASCEVKLSLKPSERDLVQLRTYERVEWQVCGPASNGLPSCAP